MKRSFYPHVAAAALAFLAAGSAPSLYAQNDYSNRMASSHLTIGPAVGVGASMSVSPPEGLKVGPILAYHFGLDASYPLTPTIGTTLGMGLESRGSSQHPDGFSDGYIDTKISYFHITPGLMFSAFYIGMNFGLPMGGSLTTKGGTTDLSSADENKLNTLLEPRIGVVIPVMDSIFGWLGMTATTGYTLDELFDRGDKPDGLDKDKWGNYQNISLYVGSTFQLAIPGTGKK